MTKNELFTYILADSRILDNCKRFSNYHPDTEDVLQDALYRVCKKSTKYLNDLYDRGKLAGYVYKSFTNQYVYKYSRFGKSKREYDDIKVDNYDITTVDLYDSYCSDKQSELHEKMIELNDNSFSELMHHNVELIEQILKDDKYWRTIYDDFDRTIFKMTYKLLEYNTVDGDKRNKQCNKDYSSTRAIEKRTGIYYGTVNTTVNKVSNYIKSIIIEKQKDENDVYIKKKN